MPTRALRSLPALTLAIALPCLHASGCALVSRGATREVSWFTPELPQPRTAAAEMQTGRELRLGGVRAGTNLGRRVAFGDGLYEAGYYDERRWTERPEHYVRRALDRALFDQGGFRRGLGGTTPVLDVEVVDFEEVKAPTVHAARIALRIVVTTDRVLLERTIDVSRPAPGPSFDAFVAAMAQALDASASEVARVTGGALGASEPANPSPSAL
jgi:cholesterol transport system auxiliary component